MLVIMRGVGGGSWGCSCKGFSNEKGTGGEVEDGVWVVGRAEDVSFVW